MMEKMSLCSKSSVFRAIFCCVLLLFLQVSLPKRVHAQPPPPDDPNSAPIDGGLGILMAAGAGLGLKKAWDARCSGSGDSSHPDAS
jgi:hypothetical protein